MWLQVGVSDFHVRRWARSVISWLRKGASAIKATAFALMALFPSPGWQWERKERASMQTLLVWVFVSLFSLCFSPCLRVCLSVYLLFLNMTQQVFHVFVLCALLWFALLFVCFALLWFVFCFCCVVMLCFAFPWLDAWSFPRVAFLVLCSVLLFLDLTHGVSHVLRFAVSLCSACALSLIYSAPLCWHHAERGSAPSSAPLRGASLGATPRVSLVCALLSSSCIVACIRVCACVCVCVCVRVRVVRLRLPEWPNRWWKIKTIHEKSQLLLLLLSY